MTQAELFRLEVPVLVVCIAQGIMMLAAERRIVAGESIIILLVIGSMIVVMIVSIFVGGEVRIGRHCGLIDSDWSVCLVRGATQALVLKQAFTIEIWTKSRSAGRARKGESEKPARHRGRSLLL